MTIRGYIALFGIIGIVGIICLFLHKQQQHLLTQKNKEDE